MPQPRVDVAIPCYRYGAMLPTAVRSVLDQDGVDVRILIIDDASGDGSADVALDLARGDDRIQVSAHEHNKGHISTFNEGVLDWPQGDYVLLLSADDALTAGALRRATSLMEANPAVSFVYGPAISWDGALPLPLARNGEPDHVIHSGPDWIRGRFAAGTNCVSSPAAVVRVSIQEQAGGYDPELLHTSDLEMWMRLALHGDVGFLAGVDQAYCREHETNMSVAYENRDGGVGDLRMRLLAFQALLRKGDGLVPLPDELDRLVRRRLAGDALLRVARAYDKTGTEQPGMDLLVLFARATARDDLTKLPEWYGLRVRQALGPRLAHLLRPLVLTAGGRRIRQAWRDRRLEHEGI